MTRFAAALLIAAGAFDASAQPTDVGGISAACEGSAKGVIEAPPPRIEVHGDGGGVDVQVTDDDPTDDVPPTVEYTYSLPTFTFSMSPGQVDADTTWTGVCTITGLPSAETCRLFTGGRVQIAAALAVDSADEQGGVETGFRIPTTSDIESDVEPVLSEADECGRQSLTPGTSAGVPPDFLYRLVHASSTGTVTFTPTYAAPAQVLATCGPTLPLEVPVDIKPGDDANSVNLEHAANLPVAILSADGFDATTLEPHTIWFGAACDRARRTNQTRLEPRLEYVDGDERLDLVLHYDPQATKLQSDDTRACLEGTTAGGQVVRGCDAIEVVP